MTTVVSDQFTVRVVNADSGAYASYADLEWHMVWPPLGFNQYAPPAGSQPDRGVLSYCNSALDPATGKIYCWGGGHSDYYANDVWAFDVMSKTWGQLTTPSWGYNPPLADVQAAVDNTNYPGAYLKDQAGNTILRPIGRHTYYTSAWCENVGKFVTGGASTYGGTNAGDYLWLPGGAYWNDAKDTWMFDPGAVTWSYVGSQRKSGQSSLVPLSSSSYHHVRGKVYSAHHNQVAGFTNIPVVWEFDPTYSDPTTAVTVHTATPGPVPSGGVIMCANAENDELFLISVYNSTVNYLTYSLSSRTWTDRTASVTGRPYTTGLAFQNDRLLWSPYKNRYVYLAALDKEIYYLSRDTWTWMKPSELQGSLPSLGYVAHYEAANYDRLRNIVFATYLNSVGGGNEFPQVIAMRV